MRLSWIFACALATSTAALDFNASNWIWTNEPSDGGGERIFRRDFTPPFGKTPNITDILVTAAETFTFYVNGQELGSGTNYQLAYAFRTRLYESGPNMFIVVVNSSSTNSNPPAGLLVAIQVTYTDSSTYTIVSDTNWSTSTRGAENFTLDDIAWSSAVEKSPYRASAWGPVAIPTTPPSFVLTNATNWIWTNEATNAAVSAPVGSRPFRLTWTPPHGQTAQSATIVTAADDQYTFFVNGNLVAGGYYWGFCQQLSVDLASAHNVVFAVNAANGGGPAGFIAEIQITTTGVAGCTDCSSSSFIITDTSWKWTDTVPAGFAAPGFNDSAWSPAVVVAAYPRGVWGPLPLSQ